MPKAIREIVPVITVHDVISIGGFLQARDNRHSIRVYELFADSKRSAIIVSPCFTNISQQ